MKKIFTFLSVVAVALSVSAETVILSNPGKSKKNVLSGTELGANVPEGFSLQCMNESKNLESGSSFTIEGANYVSIKLSNGAQNTLTLPEGYVATKLTIYSTINKDAATDRACYWKEVAGITYTEAENNGIIESFKDYANPNIQSFDIPNLNVVTFANTGEQPFIVLEVTYEEMAMAQTLPEYPDKLDLTLNGQQELPGVTVTQEMLPYDGNDYLTITITGECDANEVTLDITTPEGWDGLLVRSDYTEEAEDIVPLKAKAPAKDDEELWMPTEYAVWYGVKAGNTITFPVDGEEWGGMALLVKGDDAYMVNIDFIFEVKKAEGGEPKYPEALDFTINGEKELAGVTVDQTMDQGSLSINVLGKTDADEVSMTFATPEGWDGLLIMSLADVSDIEFAKTRSEEDWFSIEYASMYGFVKGNTVTFPVDGEDNWATIALYKGDLVYQTTIVVNFEVTKNVSDDLVFPESLVVDTFNEGLEVTQYVDWGTLTIKVEGEVSTNTFPIVIDVPEGWDGFISCNWSEDNVIISENDQQPKRTRAEEVEMIPISELGSEPWYKDLVFEKGNRFTFQPTYDPDYNRYQTVEIHLYKGDMATAKYFNLDVYVSKGEDPAIPESFEINVNPAGLTVTQGEEYGVYTINVEGECTEEEVEVTLTVPEGWDGFVGMSDSDFEPGDIEPLKKVQPIEWEPIDNMLAWGLKETNTLKFKVDGDIHSGVFYLYQGGLVDGANQISVYTNVTKSQGVGVDSVESAGAARYYDLNGMEVTDPAPGIYVKKVNGKTSKVTVK